MNKCYRMAKNSSLFTLSLKYYKLLQSFCIKCPSLLPNSDYIPDDQQQMTSPHRNHPLSPAKLPVKLQLNRFLKAKLKHITIHC